MQRILAVSVKVTVFRQFQFFLVKNVSVVVSEVIARNDM